MANDTSDWRKLRRHLDAFRAVRVAAVWFHLALASIQDSPNRLECLTLLQSAQGASHDAVARRGQQPGSVSLVGKEWRRWRGSQSLEEWETTLDGALRAPWKAVLRGEAVWVIGDWHAVPYWGKIPPELENEVRRGPAQRGTTHFFVYATAAVLWRGVRLQVACTRVGASESVAAVFQRLEERVAELGCRVLGWLLDRGFYSTELVARLEAKQGAYLIAAPRRGEKKGIAAILQAAEKQYGFAEERPPNLKQEYSMTAMHRAVPPQRVQLILGWEPVTAPAGKRRQRTLRRSKVKPGQLWRAVAWVGGGRNWTAKKAQRRYPRRNSVESSYRMSEKTRGRTSSQDPSWRMCLFGVSLLLQNAWVWLITEGKRTPKRWWRRWRARFPFIDYCKWIVVVLETQTGQRLAVDLPGV